MSRAKARSLEALLGATLGVGGGAAAGRLMYSPNFPLEWEDEDGQIRSRRLDPKEREARKQLMSHAALAGAGVGASLALGGSALRRALISSAERAAAQDTGDAYLRSLRSLIKQREDAYHGLENTRGGLGSRTAKGLRKEIDAGKKVLRAQEKKVNSLLDDSALSRAERFFGGRTWSMRQGQQVPFYQNSHEDLVKKHFDQLAKSQGFSEGFTQSNRKRLYATMIDKELGKTAEAFSREVYAISLGAA